MSIFGLLCPYVYIAIFLPWQDVTFDKNADSSHVSSFSKEWDLSVKTKSMYGENTDFAAKLAPGSEKTPLY